MTSQFTTQNDIYNRAHDYEMQRQNYIRDLERRRRQHQEMLVSMTPEQREQYDRERRTRLEEGRRQARIWNETTLRGRNMANVVSDEDERQRPM